MTSSLDVKYIGNFINQEEASTFMQELLSYDFQRYPVKVRGKVFTPNRKIIAFADDDSLKYTFSGLTVPTHPWTSTLLTIKKCVEETCNSQFNYALLNYYASGRDKIGAHKDDELALDSSSPIATISLGATRTIHFTRKNCETVKLPLENASLLIMSPSSNSMWLHAIPAEPLVSDARISITFRKLKTFCVSKRPLCESNSQPTKKQCVESTFEDSAMDGFFSNLSPSMLEPSSDQQGVISKEPSSVMNYAKNEVNETIYKKDIGGNIYLSAEMFKGYLKIHFRQYSMNSYGTMYPTKDGLTMDIPTWYDFYLKAYTFNFCYDTASFIANNDVLVLNMKDHVHIQRFKMDNCSNSPSIKLSQMQFAILLECVNDINKKIIQYLFEQYLPFLINREHRLFSILSPEEEDILLVKLIICIEDQLCEIFKSVSHCNGCVIDHPSQHQHDCIMSSSLEKYEQLGEEKILILLNMREIASQFVKTVDFISENFVKNISADLIKDVLFKTIVK